MTDVLLYQTNDDGEVNVVNGVMEMAGGLETAVYLSLFGGNEDDDGSSGGSLGWWGNIDETDPAKEQRSETQYLLRALTATSNNLRRVEQAAGRDLAWMVSAGAASEITVAATIPGVNKLKLSIKIVAMGEEKTFTFLQNWKAEI